MGELENQSNQRLGQNHPPIELRLGRELRQEQEEREQHRPINNEVEIGDVNRNKWSVNIEPLNAGYIVSIGCKRIAIQQKADLLKLLDNYYSAVEKEIKEGESELNDLFNKCTNNKEKYDFILGGTKYGVEEKL